MNKKWMAVALTAVAALGLTACSSAEDATPSPSATAADATADTAAADAAALAGLRQMLQGVPVRLVRWDIVETDMALHA